MFQISEEAKAEAINAMRDILGKYGVTDEELNESFEAAVDIVKKSFGF